MMVWDILTGAGRMAWSDFRFLQYNFIPVVVSTLITPLLYFLAFGYGLGKDVVIGDVDYIAYVIPGIIALSTVTSCFMLTAHKIQVQRMFYASFDEVLLCPITYPSIILGKTAVGLFKGFLCGTILCIMGVLMSPDFHVTFGLIAMMALSSLTFSLLGVLAAFATNAITTMNMFNSLVIIPMTFLCGTLFPVESLPTAAQYAVDILPLTHVSECMRACALGYDFPWISLAVVIGFAALFYTIAWLYLKKGKV